MHNSSPLDLTFAALSDPTRRAILARLAAGEATVNELVKPFGISQPAISRHLKVLEKAGLISHGQDAQRRPRRLEPKPLAEAGQWLEQYRQFWEDSFERLDNLLAELQSAPSPELKSNRGERNEKSRNPKGKPAVRPRGRHDKSV